MMAVGLLAVGPSAAWAQGEVADGCTAVPDSGRTFDFTEACDGHDYCYVEQPYGSSGDARRQCDSEFLDAMLASCDDMWPEGSQRFSRMLCQGVGWVYYLGVRAFGGFFWDEADPATPLTG